MVFGEEARFVGARGAGAGGGGVWFAECLAHLLCMSVIGDWKGGKCECECEMNEGKSGAD